MVLRYTVIGTTIVPCVLRLLENNLRYVTNQEHDDFGKKGVKWKIIMTDRGQTNRSSTTL